jgi:hypothetical protein
VTFKITNDSFKGTIPVRRSAPPRGRLHAPSPRSVRVTSCQYVLDRVAADGAREGTSICGGMPEETRLEIPRQVLASSRARSWWWCCWRCCRRRRRRGWSRCRSPGSGPIPISFVLVLVLVLVLRSEDRDPRDLRIPRRARARARARNGSWISESASPGEAGEDRGLLLRQLPQPLIHILPRPSRPAPRTAPRADPRRWPARRRSRPARPPRCREPVASSDSRSCERASISAAHSRASSLRPGSLPRASASRPRA